MDKGFENMALRICGRGGTRENGIDRHSVNCYFCGELFDEREGQSADKFNDGDGGDICPICLAKKEEHYCSECGQAWIVHNDDGSCINDMALA